MRNAVSVYMIIEIAITNPEIYSRYVAGVADIVTRLGEDP
jgi:uncharacterized protein (DUF1330 family)